MHPDPTVSWRLDEKMYKILEAVQGLSHIDRCCFLPLYLIEEVLICLITVKARSGLVFHCSGTISNH
jgi:hypothetical protein